MNFAFRALAAAALLWPASAVAQTFAERPYDPPAGSRWQIVSQSDSEEDRGAGGRRDQHVRSLSELTIEEKLADGYRITYVNRGMTLTGNAPGTEIADAAFKAVKDIVIHARTDRSGRPVAVENVDEVKQKMHVIIDRMADALKDKPKVADFIRQMLGSFLIADGAEAARIYVEDVPLLAAAQNTGLKPGDARRDSEELANPFGGGAIKASLVTRLTSFDNAAGTARYTRSREIDTEAMKAFVLALARRLSAAASDKVTPEVLEIMKQIKFEMTSESVFEVEGGMTRKVTERDTTKASLMGQAFTKVETKTVTITPLNK